MLTAEQNAEFCATGILRLAGAFSQDAAESMRERLWDFLADKFAVDRDDRSTWRPESPSGFQTVTHSGAFRAVGGEPLCAALDALLGAGRWRRPRWWGRPLVTFPGVGPWVLPARGWHFDFMPASARPRPVQYFAFLSAVRPRGGGTLALSGSHRLMAPYLDGGGAFRMGRVRESLAAHSWIRGLWEPGDDGDRIQRYIQRNIQRYLDNETVVDGVPLRVIELTGEPGDIVIMHCDTFHAVAPNRSAEPRMMLTEMVGPAE